MKSALNSLVIIFKDVLCDLVCTARHFLLCSEWRRRWPFLLLPWDKWSFVDVVKAYGVIAVGYLLHFVKYMLYVILSTFVSIWLFKSFFERLPENVYECFMAWIVAHFLIVFCVAVIGLLMMPVPVKDVTTKPTRQ